MTLRADVLYPTGYDEERDGEVDAVVTDGRDFDAARAIIRATNVPLSKDRLVELICGTPRRAARGGIVAMDDDEAGARAAVSVDGHDRPRVQGPSACASLRKSEVVALIDEVIEERRPTWREKTATATAGVGERVR